MLLFVICGLESQIPYEQIKSIVENTPDALWTPSVPKDKEMMEKLRKTLRTAPSVAPKSQRRLRTKQSPNLPTELDWRQKAPQCMTQIRDQGNCGSCWAFATTASFSIRKCLTLNETEVTQYSEQFMISCDTWDTGCNGGFLDTAQGFLVNTGTVPDSCISYKSSSGHAPGCQTICDNGSQLPSLQRASDFNDLILYDNIMEGIQRGPVTAEMSVYQDFMVYESGIYHHVYGNLVGYHAITIVGYGVNENNILYWIVRNSWGTSWGENGYFKIIRSTNECDIESYCYELLF